MSCESGSSLQSASSSPDASTGSRILPISPLALLWKASRPPEVVDQNIYKESTPKGSILKGSTPKGSTPKGSTPEGSTPKGSSLKMSTPKSSTLNVSTPKGSTPKGENAVQAGSPVGRPPLSVGAWLLEVDVEGCAPLALAAKYRHPDLVSLLLELKALPDATDKHGRTALMIAAGKRQKQAVRYLLAARAHPELCDVNGYTAMDFAASNHDLQAILQAEADRNAVARKMPRSSSLPNLASRASPSPKARHEVCKLRLDRLPQQLPPDLLEGCVREVFRLGGCGSPKHVDVIVDPITQVPKGTAYVGYATFNQAEAAAKWGNGKQFLHSTLRARVEAPQPGRTSVVKDRLLNP